jgi:ribosomal protein L1
MINPLLERISKSIKIRAKEASIKIAVGKENMKDEQLMENLLSVYNSIIQALPNNIENVKNVNIKFTMGKLLGVEIK